MSSLSGYQQSIREFAEAGEVTMLALTLDEYIAHLQKLRAEHGNLEVEKWMPAKGRHAAPAPVLAFKRRYAKRGPGGDEAGVPAFFQEKYDTETQRGEPVVRI